MAKKELVLNRAKLDEGSLTFDIPFIHFFYPVEMRERERFQYMHILSPVLHTAKYSNLFDLNNTQILLEEKKSTFKDFLYMKQQ